MKFIYTKLFFAIIMLGFIFVTSTSAQINRGLPPEEPLPESIQERLTKLRIEEDKDDYDKLLKHSKQLTLLSDEIYSSFEKNKRLTDADQKKLKEVDNLLDEIRDELRAKSDKDDEESPKSTLDALDNLREKSLTLYEAVKKTSRHSISVVAIQTSNTVKSIVKFLRIGK